MASSDYSWTEPESAYNTQYPYNSATVTESGHSFEMDDTPGAERVRIQHRTGTFTEIHPDGSEVHKIVGIGYEITASDRNVSIGGNCVVTIDGDAVMEVKGNYTQRIHGNYDLVVDGRSRTLTKGETTINSGSDLNISTLNQAVGKVYLTAANALVLNSDLIVHGQVLADSIASENEVTAGTGIHAGVPGSSNPFAGISTIGGINVGFPGPTVPGVLSALELITAPTVIGTVMTYGGILLDPVGGAPTIRSIYDGHIHPTPKGPSGTPIPLMPLP
jgi:hypothetical protein